MRMIALVWVLAFCLPALATERVIPITEVSSGNNPVQNQGKATLVEEGSGHSVMMAASEDWTVRNISRKPIVALIESFAIEYPDGNKSGGVEQYELFFHPDLMKPGDEVSFSEPANWATQVKKMDAPTVEPKCEIRVLWVQFADGSTFGDRKYAESLLAARTATLEGLARLRDIYTTRGSEQFALEVRKNGRNTVDTLDMYLRQLQDYYAQTSDIPGAYKKLVTWLDAGGARRYLLD